MYLRSIIVAILLFAGSFTATAHDYHASIADIRFNPQTQSLQVAIKVFTDDLENALSKRSNSKVTYDSDSEVIKKHIAGYMAATFKVELVKGKPLKQQFVGSEEDADVVWVYFEVPVQSASFKELYIENDVLTEIFDDQMNIVNLDYKGEMYSMLLQKSEKRKKVTL